MLTRLIDLIPSSATRDYVLDLAYGIRHPALLRSGASDEEDRLPLPGDELIRHAMWTATRATTIDAPPSRVWPWLAQMGWRRGGWYWWADPALEGRASATSILREFQRVEVGDVLLDGPGCDRTKGVWLVRAVDPGHSLVLYSARDPFSGRELDLGSGPARYIDCSWAFALVPAPGRSTRLLVRTRVNVAPIWAMPVARLFGAADTVMQRTMLERIKQLAERTPSRRTKVAA